MRKKTVVIKRQTKNGMRDKGKREVDAEKRSQLFLFQNYQFLDHFTVRKLLKSIFHFLR